jgi:hypothetical protein
MPTTSPRTTDPAALAAKNRSWLLASITTFVAAATGRDKSVEATCRAGKVLVGSGGEISNDQGELMLDDIEPVASINTVSVRGAEDSACTQAWQVTAHAICSDPIPGLVRVSRSSVVDSAAGKDAYAPCPLGTFLLSAGGSVIGPEGEGVINEIRPQGWMGAYVVAREEDLWRSRRRGDGRACAPARVRGASLVCSRKAGDPR